MSARCGSSKTGLLISPSKPTHDLGYGILISGARSVSFFAKLRPRVIINWVSDPSLNDVYEQNNILVGDGLSVLF